jgi:tetratricopeptide (TPR) repeat protein
VVEHRRKNDWPAIAALAREIPAELCMEWLPLADEVAFALGQLRQYDRSIRLREAAFAVEPTHRRASGLAYLYYEAMMSRHGPRRAGHDSQPMRDHEADRRAFARWMAEALRMEPDSIKDLYRLGVYEAQVENQRDAAALRAFAHAIRAYRALPAETRQRRKDLFKPYVKCLYASARSALRLGRLAQARDLSFSCIREDKSTDHIEPVHKMFLAGKICAAQGQPEPAERAFRIALDAKGPPRRDYVHTALAALFLATGRPDDASAWLDQNLPPHRRSSVSWRLTGDVRRAQNMPAEALAAYENALRHDSCGRHLTLARKGDVLRSLGRLADARAAYEKAREFRRRKYLRDDVHALDALVAMAEADADTQALSTLRAERAALSKEEAA